MISGRDVLSPSRQLDIVSEKENPNFADTLYMQITFGVL
ncbi:unnamed protein product [Acanthoscelides obtectus]|uniref:Uncharacterized protein n=1 Tax=Acanthoscelides obtectus TaxID=200917 RepID=A0A9P0MMG7_ACAOB|nr:unnamed protein product [Acanthoscelides obtectus]CAK1625345.1 hypothetical protein AOBTE_LOCUS3118 [Acanthoscelides obtectus]